MPIITVFIMGLVADLLMSDILGGRATAMMFLCHAQDFAFATKRIHGFVGGVRGVCAVSLCSNNYLQFDQSGGTVTQPLAVSGRVYADSISDRICYDVFGPTFIANLAGDAVRRGKEKDLRRIMSRRGFVLAGASVR